MFADHIDLTRAEAAHAYAIAPPEPYPLAERIEELEARADAIEEELALLRGLSPRRN
jgi:hypothetical protein